MSNDVELSGSWIAGAALVGTAYYIALLLMSGFVVSQLWGWHAVPLGLQTITFAQGVGLSCIAGALMVGFHPTKGPAKDAGLLAGVLVFVAPPATLLVLLAVGWIAS